MQQSLAAYIGESVTLRCDPRDAAEDQVVAIPANATDPQAAPQVVTTVEQRLGPVTLLINNAGQYRAFGPIGVVDPIAWWNEVEVNLRGPVVISVWRMTSTH